MFHSIRWRLVASYVLLTLLTVSMVGVLALSLIQRYVQQQEQEYLRSNAEAVARQALPLMQPVVRQTDLSELVRTASFLGNVQVRILDDRNQTIVDSGRPATSDAFMWILAPSGVRIQSSDTSLGTSIMVLPHRLTAPFPGNGSFDIFEQLPPHAEFVVVRRFEHPWGSRFVFGARQPVGMVSVAGTFTSTISLQDVLAEEEDPTPRSERVVLAPIGEGDPLGYVELSRGPGFGAEALTTARQAFLLAGGGAALLALIVGLLVGRGLTAPLRNLTAAAGQMSGGDLSIRAPVTSKDEFGQLARQFNDMAQRLEVSFADLAAERDSLRRFIADASHGLRTPITALKNFNELLLGAAADDPAARAEFLAESQIQLDRLEWITHNLLDLSRLDAGLVILDVGDHDADELIGAALSAFRTMAQEKGISLSVEPAPQPFQIQCDRRRIELALSNLLDNALKFTPAGGEVEIGARLAETEEGLGQLWVWNTGSGIPLEEQDRIFERFYRGEDDRLEGSGLGLAIVHSIAQAHAGRVFVESTPDAGNRFVIELPLLRES
jgi:signal transduction histidine kinase